MPLGVRDFLLVIRAKDQASRVVADVGRSFGHLQRQSVASMRQAQSNLKANTAAINQAFRQDIAGTQQFLRGVATEQAKLSTQNARLRVHHAQAATTLEKAAIADEIRNNNVRKALIGQQSVTARQNIARRRAEAQEQVRIVQDQFRQEKAAFDAHNAAVEDRIRRTNMIRARGQSLIGIGAAVGVAGAAGAAFFGGAAKDAIEYNKQAAKTLTQAGDLKITLEQVKDIGRDVAEAVPAPFEQMQASLYDIFSSMEIENIPQARRLLTAFAKGAVAGVTDVETASQAAISLLNAFKLPSTAENITRVMDTQFETVRVGRLEYEELARTIGRAIPSAVKAGQSMEDLGGTFAFLTRNGLSAAMAATSAARAYDLLTNPKFTQKLEAIDVFAAFQEGPNKGKFRPMLDVMTDLRNRMEGVTSPGQAKRMQEFMASMVDPDALDFLEKLGIQVKQTVGGKDFSGQIKKNASASAAIATKNAQLRVKLSQVTTKEEKKAIRDAITNNSLQKAILSEQNVNLRAHGTKAQEALRPFGAIMKDIDEKLKALSPEDRAAWLQQLTSGAGGTIQAMRFVNLAITDTDDLFGNLTRDVRESKGSWEAAYKTMKDTPAAKIQQLKNDWASLKTEIGDHVIPVLLELVEKGRAIIKWFDELSPGMKRNIALAGMLAAAFFLLAGAVTLLTGALLILKSTAIAFGLAGIPFFAFFAWLAVLAALALAVYILITRWEDFKRGLEVIGAWLGSTFGPYIGMVADQLDRIRQVIEGIVKAIQTGLEIAGKVVDIATGKGPAGTLARSGAKAIPIIGPVIGPILDAIPGRATGGTIPGPRGAPRLIMAHGGEEIISNSSYRHPDVGGRRNSGGDTYVNIPVQTDVDAQEIAHEVVFGLRYG